MPPSPFVTASASAPSFASPAPSFGGLIAATEAAALLVVALLFVFAALSAGTLSNFVFGPPLPSMSDMISIWLIAAGATSPAFASVHSFVLANFILALLFAVHPHQASAVFGLLVITYGAVYLARYINQIQFGA